jgi:hypothetical protein
VEGTVLTGIWSFLQDPGNRAIIGWIGGGVTVVCGAIWAVVKFFLSRGAVPKSAPAPSVTAADGGVAAGRDIRDSKIDTRDRPKR